MGVADENHKEVALLKKRLQMAQLALGTYMGLLETFEETMTDAHLAYSKQDEVLRKDEGRDAVMFAGDDLKILKAFMDAQFAGLTGANRDPAALVPQQVADNADRMAKLLGMVGPDWRSVEEIIEEVEDKWGKDN